ncbi:MAG: hypothetical protein OIF50_13655 [Flavobacteriaceae bacterium]|nr:hypothetical protein [Flavobacteriaceae bacterium]
MNKTRIYLAICILFAVPVIVIGSCTKEEEREGYMKVTLINGKRVSLPTEIAKGSKSQPMGTLYYLEGEGIIELTKYGWKNFKGETVLTDFSE